MAQYSYIAIARDGKEKKGSIEANDEDKVRAKIKAEGLIPLRIAKQNVFTKDISITLGNPIKPRDLSVFCRQINSVLEAGVTVVDALEMLGEQTENQVFKRAIQEVKVNVEKGESLADAMRMNEKIFPSILVNMVEAGEASGSLDKSFARMATHFEKSSKLSSLLKKAMIYPSVLLVVVLVVIIAMSVFVVPKFAEMFEEMGSELPFITKVVMAISDFFREKWYIAIVAAATTVVAIKSFAATEYGKVLFGTMKIKVPIFGKLAVKSASASFSRTLSTLVSSGLSISQAIYITGRSMDNILFQRVLEDAKDEVEKGISLSEPIKKSGLFPPMVYHMLKIGEETGNLEGMLDKVAEYYEDEVEIATQGLTTALEPLIIVVMGIVIGFLVMAIYMPMIQMYQGLNNL